MSNSKKITDLAPYTDTQVQSDDLLFITDIAAQETKKITSIDLADYVISAKSASIYNGNYNGTFTGSFKGDLNGTSSWAINALTAAYAANSSGESNTASNVGTSGVGFFKQKSGVDLQFKNIVAGTNCSLSENLTENTITVNLTSTTTSPGGPVGSVQFNVPGSQFGGNSNLSWDTTNNDRFTVIGGINSTTFTSSVLNAVGYLGTASYSTRSDNANNSISSSFSSKSQTAETASYFAGTGAVLSANSIQYNTKQSGTGTSWVDTGLSITITPKSVNSKLLINTSIVLANGDATGNAIAGLFKDSTPLLEQFASVNLTKFDASPQTTTYLDVAGSLSARTYVVKVKGSEATATWYTNQSSGYPTLYWATSSMTILEFNI
jgi:hypothetical protein